VKHYLVVFDRGRGKVLDLREFDDADAALRARFAAEATHRCHPSIEVVVLGARSKDALRRTHGRYFEDVAGLTRRALEAVKSGRRAPAL
jgi:hypothetical protein